MSPQKAADVKSKDATVLPSKAKFTTQQLRKVTMAKKYFIALRFKLIQYIWDNYIPEEIRNF